VTAVLRDGGGRVTPLELFFDLVLVLALTQCTALMAAQPDVTGVAQGLLVLAVVWWSWVGYAWLTSVVDPEEGAVRLVVLGAMAGLLVAALCIPRVFGEDGLLFAGAYATVRVAHIGLFLIASRDDPALRRSVVGLGVSTAVGVTLLSLAAPADGWTQGGLWLAAIALDMAGPYLFGAEGWRLVPEHFAERHGLILIIALGESIVGIGLGAAPGVDAGVVAGAVLGIAVAGAMWWLYFDVVALAAAHRLEHAAPGRERNEMARDSYSFLHFPMIAGIVLVALGFKKALGEVGDPLYGVPALALMGGAAAYLLAHVAFRWRNMRTLSMQRLVAAAGCLALVPVALEVPALVSVALLALVLAALIVYERLRFAEARARLRAELRH
jgi:low temperature requirement protein LtrA